MEKTPENLKFKDILVERLKSLPKTSEVADQIFNYVSGGYDSCDNASLSNEDMETILRIIKETASATNDGSIKMSKLYQESAKKIDEIIDSALG